MTKTKKIVIVICAMLFHQQEFEGQRWKIPLGACISLLFAGILAPVFIWTGWNPSKDFFLLFVVIPSFAFPFYVVPRLLDNRYIRVIRLTERQKFCGNCLLALLMAFCFLFGIGSLEYWNDFRIPRE